MFSKELLATWVLLILTNAPTALTQGSQPEQPVPEQPVPEPIPPVPVQPVQPNVPSGGPKSFESFNFPNMYLSFNNAGEGKLLANKESYFLRPGLTGQPGTVSFESVDKPNHFLRHYGFLVDLENAAGPPRFPNIFKPDATFKLHQDKFHFNTVAFESVNYRGRYIRHQGSRLKIDLSDGSDSFKADASWNNVILVVLLDVTGSQKWNIPGRLAEDVDIMKDLFDYTTTPQGYRSVLGKISSIHFVPFNTRLELGKMDSYAPSKFNSTMQLQAVEGPLRAAYNAKFLGFGPKGLTDIGKSLQQTDVQAANRGHYSVVIVSDFINTIININPVNVVNGLTGKAVQVFPIILDSPTRHWFTYDAIRAATVNQKGYDEAVGPGVNQQTFKDIIDMI